MATATGGVPRRATVDVMKVEIWSDIACPWCYVGKRRFEAALAAFEHRDDVRVTWRSFELDPSAPAEREETRTTVIAVATDRYEGVPSYDSFWDVPVAEVAETESVRSARAEYETGRASERQYL